MLTVWDSAFTKLLTKHGKHIITEYKMEILFSFEYYGHFQHLRSQFFTLYRPFASLGVNAFGCFVGRIHLNQNEYCYSMFFL